MRKYLELFTSNLPSDIANKIAPANWPYIGYSVTEDKVVYTEISSDEEPDPTAGYVDLGLSVMWASCNLGASSPEEAGLFYSWGEVEGHELAADGESFKDGHIFSEENYQSPNTDKVTATLSLSNDAVYQFMLKHPNHDMSKFRMPTFAQYNELVENTTSELSIVNNIPVYTLTSIVNGNSIQIPAVGGFSSLLENKNNHHNSYSYLWSTAQNAGKLNGTNYNLADVYDYVNHSFLPNQCHIYTGLPIRGVCDPLPLADFLFPGKKYNIAKDKVYAVRCEHGLEMPYTGTIQLSATPDFNTFVTIEVKDLIQLTPLDLTLYVSGLLITGDSSWIRGKFNLELYCYIKFNEEISTDIHYCNTNYLNTPLLYNGLAVYIDEKTIDSLQTRPTLRVKYDMVKNKTITVKSFSNGTINLGVTDSLTDYLNSTTAVYYTSISRRSSITIDSETIGSWEDHIDENGYIYLGYYCSSGDSDLEFTIE